MAHTDPGHLHTPIGDHGGEEGRRKRRAANLLGVEGTAWDMAWAALFLAGAESRWITGAVIPVGAGATAATALAMLPHLAEPQPAAGESARTQVPQNRIHERGHRRRHHT